ncbi:unnamed protein product [Heligmosomoides polygyrus]|uniref:Phospholipid scramblase n=1 Tax=Heligmosomoides polygyrus TaxID=6339 RepID=A0A183G100_HELPZ|nr:unnamed protein product [Heligmosomoides polygyrus]
MVSIQDIKIEPKLPERVRHGPQVIPFFKGGYRITLIDKDGNTVEELAPINGIEFAGNEDNLAQSENVRFTRACSECTVLLERQALEWGKSYRFRSCADVNVLETVPGNIC